MVDFVKFVIHKGNYGVFMRYLFGMIPGSALRPKTMCIGIEIVI